MNKYASHQDEIDDPLGLTTPDHLNYHDRVQRTYYQAEAGRHAARMIPLILNVRGDLIPRRDIEMLLAEVREIAGGNGRVAMDAGVHVDGCACAPTTVRDMRCLR